MPHHHSYLEFSHLSFPPPPYDVPSSYHLVGPAKYFPNTCSHLWSPSHQHTSFHLYHCLPQNFCKAGRKDNGNKAQDWLPDQSRGLFLSWVSIAHCILPDHLSKIYIYIVGYSETALVNPPPTSHARTGSWQDRSSGKK